MCLVLLMIELPHQGWLHHFLKLLCMLPSTPSRSSTCSHFSLPFNPAGHTPASSLNKNNGVQAGGAATAADAVQQPASRPKSILRRASSPAREPTAAEATLALPGEGQQQQQPVAAAAAPEENEEELEPAAAEGPEEAPVVQTGPAEDPSKQPSRVEATMEEPAAAEEEEKQQPANGGKAGATQRRGRQASQRPAASDRTAATDPGAAKPAPTATEVSSPAQAAKQRAEQRAAAAALKASQRPPAVAAATKPSQRKPAAAAAVAPDPYADEFGSDDEEEQQQPVAAAGRKAAAGGKKQTQPSQQGKAAVGGGRRKMQGGAGGKKVGVLWARVISGRVGVGRMAGMTCRVQCMHEGQRSSDSLACVPVSYLPWTISPCRAPPPLLLVAGRAGAAPRPPPRTPLRLRPRRRSPRMVPQRARPLCRPPPAG